MGELKEWEGGRRAEFIRGVSGVALVVGSGGGRGGWEESGLIIGMALVRRFGGMTECSLEEKRSMIVLTGKFSRPSKWWGVVE